MLMILIISKLSKTDHIKKYGYAETFKPLLEDLNILED